MSTPQQAPRVPPCEKCGGARVGNIQVIGHVGLQPAGKTYWAEPMSRINAVVCLTCGLIENYAAGLDKIRAAAQQNPDWFTW